MNDNETMQDQTTIRNNRRVAIVLGLIALGLASLPFFYLSKMTMAG
ncbi:MAG: hypothetical protein GXP22_06800 [Gammaproteobacteria bacterium]|nr:hypothetical protein [Gammaproteobacteria bacterium]